MTIHPSQVSFSYQNRPLRIEPDSDGEPLFHVGDLCALLEHSNPSQAVRQHVQEDDLTKREVIDALGRPQMALYVREPGMWSLILGSHAPSAQTVKRWVTSEVLPSIRKTGAYATPASHPAIDPNTRFLAMHTMGYWTLCEVPKDAHVLSPEQLADEIRNPHFPRHCLPDIMDAATSRMRGLISQAATPVLPANDKPAPAPMSHQEVSAVDEITDECETEARKILSLVLGRQVKVPTINGTFWWSIGELARFGAGENLTPPHPASRGMVNKTLTQHGCHLSDDRRTLLISNTHSAIGAILRDTPWSYKWSLVLKRIDGAEPTTRSFRFGPVVSRAVAVPVRLCLENSK